MEEQEEGLPGCESASLPLRRFLDVSVKNTRFETASSALFGLFYLINSF